MLESTLSNWTIMFVKSPVIYLTKSFGPLHLTFILNTIKALVVHLSSCREQLTVTKKWLILPRSCDLLTEENLSKHCTDKSLYQLRSPPQRTSPILNNAPHSFTCSDVRHGEHKLYTIKVNLLDTKLEHSTRCHFIAFKFHFFTAKSTRERREASHNFHEYK